jgi:hypothetical protein
VKFDIKTLVVSLVVLASFTGCANLGECLEYKYEYPLVCKPDRCTYRDINGSCTSWSQKCGPEQTLTCVRRADPKAAGTGATAFTDVRRQLSEKFEYTLNLPRGWTQRIDPTQGKWETVLAKENKSSDGSSVDGVFRVYALHAAFGYSSTRYTNYWGFLSENIVPGSNTWIPLAPFTALKLPAGWEARITALRNDPGRAVWVARQEGELIFLYIFAFNPPLFGQDAKGRLDYNKDPTFTKNKAALEYLIANTKISLRDNPTTVASGDPRPRKAVPASPSVAKKADGKGCPAHFAHVKRYIFDPKYAGSSKKAALATIAGSSESEKEKQILKSMTQIYFDKNPDEVGYMVWDFYNCNESRLNNVDIDLLWKKYGAIAEKCGLAGRAAYKAAEARDRGATYAQFTASYEEELAGPVPASGLLKDLLVLGAEYAYGDGKSKKPADARFEVVFSCFKYWTR